MRFAGIDIGSRSIELIMLEYNEIVLERQTDSTFDLINCVEVLLDGVRYDKIRRILGSLWLCCHS